MNLLSAKSRITIGLVSLLISVLCMAMLIDMVPERSSAVLHGRAQLCETIALCGSDYVSRGELRRLEILLRMFVERNADLISAGVRREGGNLVADVNGHAAHWDKRPGDRSTDTHVFVPIRSGQKKWGSVELRFQPIGKSGLAGLLANPWLNLTLFVCAASYLLFLIYLQRMLAHLDPSKTVPRRVRAALDSLAEGLLVIDRHGRIVLANQAFGQWVHRLPDKLLGLHAAKLNWVKNEQGDPIEEYPWVEALRQEVPLAGVMLALCHKGEPTRVLIANASPVLGQDGTYRGVLVSFDDVTQLEETKRDLRTAKKAADDANRAKSDFLARMSHDIRTPMNAILGYTDVLRRGFDETIEDRHEYLNSIHASGEHLLALINDILDLSKIESGRLQLELERHSPYELIRQVVSLLRVKAEEKGITLNFECAGLLPETILTDSVRLRQTIMNLAGNAIKFTDQGGVRIVARLQGMPSDGRETTGQAGNACGSPRLAIDVIDTGIGISKEAQQRVFDPFSQADTSITRRYGGTGLGLSISRQLAEALGGGVTLESQPGKGSTFTVAIDPGPLEGVRLLDAQQAQAFLLQKSTQKTQTVQLPPARILVVDDGDSNRRLMEIVLRRAGAAVETAENGRVAVDRALAEPYDAILMDMRMPVMDGYTAASLLREHGYQRPIIALTAAAMQEDERNCRAAGCSAFLPKPIDLDRLVATLAQELRRTDCQSVQSLPDLSLVPAIAQELSQLAAGDCEIARAEPGDSQGPPREMQKTLTHDAWSCGELEYDCVVQKDTSPIVSSLPTDDPDFREIVVDFIERLHQKLDAMQQAWQGRDLEQLAQLAHWLKGSGGTAGFDEFTAPARSLEQRVKNRQLDQIKPAIYELRAIAARIAVPTPA